jgi:hypothetical protein
MKAPLRRPRRLLLRRGEHHHLTVLDTPPIPLRQSSEDGVFVVYLNAPLSANLTDWAAGADPFGFPNLLNLTPVRVPQITADLGAQGFFVPVQSGHTEKFTEDAHQNASTR